MFSFLATLTAFTLSTFSCGNLGARLSECFTQCSYFTLVFRLSFDPAHQRGSLHRGPLCDSSLLLFVIGYLQVCSLGDMWLFYVILVQTWFQAGAAQGLGSQAFPLIPPIPKWLQNI